MADSQTTAILLRHEHKLDDALHYAALLIDSGAKVAFFCLCRRRCRSGLWNVLPLLDTEAACYTDDPRLAKRYELDCLTDAGLVQLLKTVDWVIPF
ncbi:MAG: hypothetical protein PVG41_10675 [Desulfobacteraceae bacterium]|jgi:hypothetical protein